MSLKSKWDKDAGKQMWLEGKPDKEIAAAYGVSSTAVRQIRKKYWEPSALAVGAEEIPVQDPVQRCADEQQETDAPERTSTEELDEDDSKVMIRALELLTARLKGMDAVVTARIVTTLWGWESKEDLLNAKEFLDYLIRRAE